MVEPADFYKGPYKVLSYTGRIGYIRPKDGEIVQHSDPAGNPTDNWRLRCPVCHKRVHVFAKQIGEPDVPTFDRPVKCGCGARCGVWFRIRSGMAELTEEPGKDPKAKDIFDRAAALPGVMGKPRRKNVLKDEKNRETT